MSTGGKKFDAGKPRLDLIDREFENAICLARAKGSRREVLNYWLRGVPPTSSAIKEEAPEVAVGLWEATVLFPFTEPDMLFGLGAVLASGAEKYGDNNWLEGIELHRLERAFRGHAFRAGFNDEESGLPHRDHAVANLMFMWFLHGH